MNDSFVFIINKNIKNSMLKRYVAGSKELLPFKIISWVLVLGAVALPIVAHVAPYLVSILLFFFILMPAGLLIRVFISHQAEIYYWKRPDERIWVTEGKLYHFFRKCISDRPVLREHHEVGVEAHQYIIDIDSIRNAKYDPRSKRIEFNANIRFIKYSNYVMNLVEGEYTLSDTYYHYLFDYTEPGLYQFLLRSGVQFENTRFEYFSGDVRP